MWTTCLEMKTSKLPKSWWNTKDNLNIRNKGSILTSYLGRSEPLVTRLPNSFTWLECIKTKNMLFYRVLRVLRALLQSINLIILKDLYDNLSDSFWLLDYFVEKGACPWVHSHGKTEIVANNFERVCAAFCTWSCHTKNVFIWRYKWTSSLSVWLHNFLGASHTPRCFGTRVGKNGSFGRVANLETTGNPPTHHFSRRARFKQLKTKKQTNKKKTDKHLTAQVRLFVVLVVKTKRLQTLSTSRVDTTTRADKEATSKLRKETRTLPSYGDEKEVREEERVEAEGDSTPEEKVKRKVLKLLPKPTLFTLSIKTYHLRWNLPSEWRAVQLPGRKVRSLNVTKTQSGPQ